MGQTLSEPVVEKVSLFFFFFFLLFLHCRRGVCFLFFFFFFGGGCHPTLHSDAILHAVSPMAAFSMDSSLLSPM